MADRDLIDLSADVRAVLDRITMIGRPLIVGGTVRDALLARKAGEQVAPKDLDVEVHGVADYPTIARTLTGTGVVNEQGARFGVLAVRTPSGEDIDISLPRREISTGPGHLEFEVEIDPAMPLREAFGRRDFTVNAIGWDHNDGQIVDPHNGLRDLEAGKLRPTSDQFEDDPLRVLRAMQFIARFDFSPTTELVERSRSMVDRFGTISRERVWGEWSKLARRGRYLVAALRFLDDSGWIHHFPALERLRGVEQDPTWHPEGDVLTHSILAAQAAADAAHAGRLNERDREIAVLGALLHDVGKPSTTRREDGGRIRAFGHESAGAPIARAFLRSLAAPDALAQRVGILVAEHMSHHGSDGAPTPSAVRRLMRRLDADGAGVTIDEWARVVNADVNGRGAANRPSPARAWVALANSIGPTPRPSLLRGEHLARLGFAPGPGWALLIEAAVEAQDNGEFDDVEGALSWLERTRAHPVGYPARPSNAQWASIRRWLSRRSDVGPDGLEPPTSSV